MSSGVTSTLCGGAVPQTVTLAGFGPGLGGRTQKVGPERSPGIGEPYLLLTSN